MASERGGVFGYPFGGADREEPVVVGWILVLLAVVPLGSLAPVLGVLAYLWPAVPLVPFVGYLVRVLGASVDGDAAPSVRERPLALVRNGAAGSAIAAAYLLVPLAALAITVYGAIWSSATPDMDFTGSLAVYGGSTVVLCLFIAGTYLVPAALTIYAGSGSVRSAFSPGEIRPVALHAAYFARWTAGAVTFSMGVSLANVIGQAPRIGPVLGALVAAYGSILACHVWGRAVAVARSR